MSNPSSLMEVRQVSKRFGSTIALEEMSLRLHSGRVLAVIGENGAGKSTLMKILSGAISPDAGQLMLAGETYRPQNPHQARLSGVSMIYQELTIAPDLSIEDNILLGCESSRFGLLDRRRQHERLRKVIELLHLDWLPLSTPARKLSPGQQQLIEIARALVVEARVVIFDEPTSSLTAEDVQQLFHVIRLLKQQGIAVAYISHFLEEVREICDDFVIIRDGQHVAEGKVREISDAEIVEHMIGRTVEELFPTVPHQPGEVLLEVNDFVDQQGRGPNGLKIHRGEILGIAGLIGSGRTEFLRSLYRLDAIQSGQLKMAETVSLSSPAAAIRAGIGYLSEDRKGEGLAQSLSLVDNTTLSDLSPYTWYGWLNLKHRRLQAENCLQEFQVKAASSSQLVRELSGGNQQKVALARVLHQQADLWLLDEPTRGIDLGTKAEIYRLLGELAATGKAILMISSYLPELMAICDRIAVMNRGKLLDTRPRSEWTEHEIMQQAVKSEAG